MFLDCPVCEGKGWIAKRVIMRIGEINLPIEIGELCKACNGKGVKQWRPKLRSEQKIRQKPSK